MADAGPTDNAPDPIIGRIIGNNFRVVQLIGAGAMGRVYQAEQLSLGKMVAVKLLHSELMGDEMLIKRFELEAKNASSLNHVNSIQIIDFGRDGSLLYIAMELLPGVDLAQLLEREGELPLGRIARIMDQVLAALDEAHAQGIIHRDLKPGNIMLVSRRGERDFVKVCDFGIAKAQTPRDGEMLTMKGLVCGTPEYMSPEQARGEVVDGRSDLYAVACILYQLVTGHVPFGGTAAVEVLSKHLVEPPPAILARRRDGAVPPALDALIMRGLAKERGDRPQTAAEFRQELRVALPGLVDRWSNHTFGTPGPSVSAATSIGHPSSGGPTVPVSSGAPTMMRPSTQVTGTPGRKIGPIVIGVVGLSAVGLFVLLWANRETPLPATGTPTAIAPPTAAAIALPAPGPVPQQAAAPAQPPIAVAPIEEPAPQPAPPKMKDVAHHLRRMPVPAPPARTATVPAEKPRAVAELPPSPPTPVAAIAPPRPAPAPTSPAATDGSDLLKEASKLLRQGESAAACKKGEEAKRASPGIAAIYEFLGKCYNRTSDPQRANENNRRYLELAPDAPNAAFIRSSLK